MEPYAKGRWAPVLKIHDVENTTRSQTGSGANSVTEIMYRHLEVLYSFSLSNKGSNATMWTQVVEGVWYFWRLRPITVQTHW